MALGSRLFILDNMKGTVESCGPLGEDHQIHLYYQNTEPVDVKWCQWSPLGLWTDYSFYRGIGFMAKRGGPSTGITSLNQFQKATGIHVYYGDAYERQTREDCLQDEFTCNDTVCIPMSWRCDELVDCSLTTISKFFSSKRVKKYSNGEESLTGVSNGVDSLVSASVSNPAYRELDFGTYTKGSDESKI